MLSENAKLIFVLIVRRFTWSWLQHGGVPARLRPRSDLRRLQRSHTCVVMVSGYSSRGDVPVYWWYLTCSAYTGQGMPISTQVLAL